MITKTCDTCGGEGWLFRQIDVDHFVPEEVCPDCSGREFVPILCDECQEPFNDDEWATAEKYGSIVYHKRCMEE